MKTSHQYDGICPVCHAKAVGAQAEPRGNAMQIPFICTDCGLRWTLTTSACAFNIATKYHNERVDNGSSINK